MGSNFLPDIEIVKSYPAINPPSTPSAVDSGKRTHALNWIGWSLVLGLLAYFVQKNVPRYFVFTPQSYGSYFWPRVTWLFPHVACGLLAVIIGPLQFWPRMRRDYLQAHRIAGRAYVVAVVAGSVASWGMAAKISGAPAYSMGLACLGLAWVTTTLMAFVAIRRKHLLQHRQWMVRSYVVTFAFVSFRLADDLMGAAKILDSDERAKLLAWGCWAIPLLVTEVVLRAGAVFRGRQA